MAGALGRRGRMTPEDVRQAPDLEFAGGLAQHADPAAFVYADVAKLLDEKQPDVIVDFTPRPVTQRVARAAVKRGVAPVIGSSEWSAQEREELRALCESRHAGAMLIPNFAIAPRL